MSEQGSAPPWPADIKVPRWARGGRPRLYSWIQLDNLDRYHVALYEGSWFITYLVEIVEPGGSGEARSAQVSRVVWPRDPLARFNEIEARHRALSMYFGRHRN